MSSTSLHEINEAIERGLSAPHKAADIALELFILSAASGDDATELRQAKDRLLSRLPAWGMKDLIATQASYAKRLATSPGPLLYEEMHKLFSLCDVIRALRHLGLTLTNSELEELESALRERFSSERGKAILVAKDKAEDWNRDSWWYVENLDADEVHTQNA